MSISKEYIYKLLEEVMDPEIPQLSVVDLGVITDVTINEDDSVSVTMTPTFAGCPALKMMQDDITAKLASAGITESEVIINYDNSWDSNRISEKGREKIKKWGLAPPVKHNGLVQIEMLTNVECPYCSSRNTKLQTPFGPTLCRAIHYCNNCMQAFEQFKPV